MLFVKYIFFLVGLHTVYMARRDFENAFYSLHLEGIYFRYVRSL